jgi:hypothetical protein
MPAPCLQHRQKALKKRIWSENIGLVEFVEVRKACIFDGAGHVHGGIEYKHVNIAAALEQAAALAHVERNGLRDQQDSR